MAKMLLATLLAAPAGAAWLERFPTLHTAPGSAPRKLVPLADGGFLLTAPVQELALDGHLLRLDGNGRPRWERRYPGPGVSAVAAEGTTGILLDGGDGGSGFWLLATDPQGQPLWSWSSDSSERIADAVAAPDGGFLLLLLGPDRLVKVDATGSVTWSRIAPASATPAGLTAALPDGYLLHYPRAAGGSTLVRLDASGGVVWAFDASTYVLGATALAGGGFALVGQVPATFQTNLWLMRLDAAGAPVWQRAWDAGGVEPGGRVVTATSGDLFAACHLLDANLWHYLVARFDRATGNLVAHRIYDLAADPAQVEPVEGLVASDDGGCALAMFDGEGLALLRVADDATSDGCGLEGTVTLRSGNASVTLQPAAVSLPTVAFPIPAPLAPAVVDAASVRTVLCGLTCATGAEPVRRVQAVKSGGAVRLEWTADLLAPAYNVWYVTDRGDIDDARESSSPPALPVLDCTPTLPASTTCDDAGALARDPSSVFFYQVRVACAAGSEGP